jgi:murein L,D-transpeptidase YafK
MRFRHLAYVSLMALALAGCNDTLDSATSVDLSKVKNKVEQPLPSHILADMSAKSMDRNSPIMIRILKEEGVMEIWKAKTDNRFDKIAEYKICAWSGRLGPKVKEGDRQAPEGFYNLSPANLNPNSKYYLAINTGFPNRYDAANGRSGANLMIHGACSSSGCYSMTDQQVLEIYAFARDAFKGGQKTIELEAFPFRMTAENMVRHRLSPNYDFWKMLKVGYDNFEITKVPPKVDVCEKRYVFNQVAADGQTFDPTGPCPATTQPDSLKSAYNAYQSTYDTAYNGALKASVPPPKPTIAGVKEASIVSDWSKRRARGERVPIDPPSLNNDGSVTETARMGRIDSPAGRKMAALDAEKAAKQKAEEQRLAAIEAAKQAKEAAKAQALAEKEAAKAAKEAPVATATIAAPTEAAPAAETQAADAGEGTVTKIKNKLLGMFGG